MAVNAPWLIKERGANSVLCISVTNSQEPLDETEPHIDRLTPQALIDALIAIDLAFEREREELNQSRLGTVSWYPILRALREHHQRREPYVQQYIARQERSEARSRLPDQSTSIA
jgi:hypothetical protein